MRTVKLVRKADSKKNLFLYEAIYYNKKVSRSRVRFQAESATAALLFASGLKDCFILEKVRRV